MDGEDHPARIMHKAFRRLPQSIQRWLKLRPEFAEGFAIDMPAGSNGSYSTFSSDNTARSHICGYSVDNIKVRKDAFYVPYHAMDQYIVGRSITSESHFQLFKASQRPRPYRKRIGTFSHFAVHWNAGYFRLWSVSSLADNYAILEYQTMSDSSSSETCLGLFKTQTKGPNSRFMALNYLLSSYAIIPECRFCHGRDISCYCPKDPRRHDFLDPDQTANISQWGDLVRKWELCSVPVSSVRVITSCGLNSVLEWAWCKQVTAHSFRNASFDLLRRNYLRVLLTHYEDSGQWVVHEKDQEKNRPKALRVTFA